MRNESPRQVGRAKAPLLIQLREFEICRQTPSSTRLQKSFFSLAALSFSHIKRGRNPAMSLLSEAEEEGGMPVLL